MVNPPQIQKRSVVEYHDMSKDDGCSNAEMSHSSQRVDIGTIPNIQRFLDVKIEKIQLLECTVVNLSNRIGTEIVDDDDRVVLGCPSVVIPRYTSNVNTLNYQLDGAFGKRIYFKTNVRFSWLGFFQT